MTLERILLYAFKGLCVAVGTILGKKLWETAKSQFEKPVRKS
ncbi:hypothetical protein FACS1894137_13810 [Spirochaetia bacterium]|nr:hypothetical protein FACS1894137_13810 [Spirochaetia bacterium]